MTVTRAFMEPRFGHDFREVRVHTDARASTSAEAVHAQAYTVGRDIAFASGAYTPGSAEGQRLLAHELTHVVQQRATGYPHRGPSEKPGGFQTELEIGEPGDTHEREADRIAQQVTRMPAGERQWPLQESAKEPVPALMRLWDSPRNVLQRNGKRGSGSRERSRESRPKDVPRRTKPIDISGLDHEDVELIKDGVGAGPADWVGISPEGHVITTDEEGNAVDHGPFKDYLPRVSETATGRRLSAAATGGLIGAGMGAVLGGLAGGIAGGTGGSLVAPGVGTVAGAAGGAIGGAEAGALMGAAIGTPWAL